MFPCLFGFSIHSFQVNFHGDCSSIKQIKQKLSQLMSFWRICCYYLYYSKRYPGWIWTYSRELIWRTSQNSCPMDTTPILSVPTILIRLTKRHTSTVYDLYLRLSFKVDKILFQVKKKIKKKVCQLRTIDCESMIMQQIEIFGFCLNWRTFLRRVMSYWSCGLAKNQAWTNDS